MPVAIVTGATQQLDGWMQVTGVAELSSFLKVRVVDQLWDANPSFHILYFRFLLGTYFHTNSIQHPHEETAWRMQAPLKYSLEEIRHVLKYYVNLTGRSDLHLLARDKKKASYFQVTIKKPSNSFLP